jgi:hypothetical protein
MIHVQFRVISGIIPVLFLLGSLLVGSACSASEETSSGLSEEDKRIIMGAQKMKKRKKALEEKKVLSKSKQDTREIREKSNPGTD